MGNRGGMLFLIIPFSFFNQGTFKFIFVCTLFLLFKAIFPSNKRKKVYYNEYIQQ